MACVCVCACVLDAYYIWFRCWRVCSVQFKGYHLLSSHLESYFNVRLKLYSFLPVDMLYRSVRNITVSALVNSAFVPEYCKDAHIY